MVLTFGGQRFTDPVALSFWEPPTGGIFAIVVPMGEGWRPVYFGEAANFATAGFPRHHPCFGKWVLEAGGEDKLRIARHAMTGAGQDERREILAALIREYAPPCNQAELAQMEPELAGVR